MWPRYPPVARRHCRERATVLTSDHENGRGGNGYGPSRYPSHTSAAAMTALADPEITIASTPALGNACTRYGVAFPTVSAPTMVPTANPRRARNHVAIIFIAGGY